MNASHPLPRTELFFNYEPEKPLDSKQAAELNLVNALFISNLMATQD